MDELIDALLEMVKQYSHEDQGGMLYSGCLSANADAMRLLGRLGYLDIVRDYPGTRNVWAMLPRPQGDEKR